MTFRAPGILTCQWHRALSSSALGVITFFCINIMKVQSLCLFVTEKHNPHVVQLISSTSSASFSASSSSSENHCPSSPARRAALKASFPLNGFSELSGCSVLDILFSERDPWDPEADLRHKGCALAGVAGISLILVIS